MHDVRHILSERNCRNKHIATFGWKVILQRNTRGFHGKCRWNILLEKMCAFLPSECLHRIPCLFFHVWTIRRCMSDTLETMGGLSGVPNGTSSQTIKRANQARRVSAIENRADADQTAASRGLFCRGCHKGTPQKSQNCLLGMR